MKYYLDFMGARAVSLNSSIVFLGRFNRNSTGAMYQLRIKNYVLYYVGSILFYYINEGERG